MFSLDETHLFTDIHLFKFIDNLCNVVEEKQFNIGIPLPTFKLMLRGFLNVQLLVNGLFVAKQMMVIWGHQ